MPAMIICQTRQNSPEMPRFSEIGASYQPVQAGNFFQAGLFQRIKAGVWLLA